MNTVKIPVYGAIAEYGNIELLSLKKDYTLICLKYICSVSSPLRRHGLLLVKTLTHVL